MPTSVAAASEIPEQLYPGILEKFFGTFKHHLRDDPPSKSRHPPNNIGSKASGLFGAENPAKVVLTTGRLRALHVSKLE